MGYTRCTWLAPTRTHEHIREQQGSNGQLSDQNLTDGLQAGAERIRQVQQRG